MIVLSAKSKINDSFDHHNFAGRRLVFGQPFYNLPTSEGKSKSKASENKGSFLQKQTATSWKRPNSGLECKMRTLLGVLDPAATFQTRVVKKKKGKNTAQW